MTTCVMTFPGRPESAAAARRWAARCLPGCPAAADVQLCVSELVTNAVTHSRSGLVPGGKVRVRIAIAQGTWVRVEVRDDGPADWTHAAATAGAVTEPDELAPGGRGLWLVRELAGGHAGAGGRGLYWARLPWTPGEAPPPEPWGARWLTVMERAGWRCECSGQCGRAGHRCPSGHAPGYPLHVVPAVPAGDAAAAALPACALVALCAGCRAGADRSAARSAAAAPQPDALFAPGGGAR
jgi:anti-sigma regulatory factor (Ser/Thr protein kinase)